MIFIFDTFCLLIISCFAYCCNSAVATQWTMVEPSYLPSNYLQLLIGEGLCNDGKHFILSAKDSIHLIDSITYATLYDSGDAIPHDLRQEHGYNHLGDCTYYNGFIYYAVEEPTFTKPAIFIYKLNVEDEKYSIKFDAFKVAPGLHHMPWVALDTSTQILYSSEYSNTSTLYKYDAITLEFVGTLEISMTLDQVQGGAFYDKDGLLYVGANTKDTVYAINVTTGVVDIALVQGEDKEYEFEGLTFLDLRDVDGGRGVMHNTGNHWFPDRIMHAEPV